MSEIVRYSFVEFREGRYNLNELIRQFALSRLDVEEKYQAEKRHARFHLQVVNAANNLYMRGRKHILEGLTLFDQELPHISAGELWASKNLDSDEVATMLSDDYPSRSYMILQLRLLPRQRILWLISGAKAAEKLQRRNHLGHHLGNLGSAYFDLGEMPTAIEYYQQALLIAREIGDKRNEATWLGDLGSTFFVRGELTEAILYNQSALTIARECGDQRGESNILGNLGNCYTALGEVQKAIDYWEQSLIICRKIGEERSEGANLGNRGTGYFALGNMDRATQYWSQSLAIARKIGDRQGEATNLANMGLAYKRAGESQNGKEFLQQALKIRQEIQDPRVENLKKWLEELDNE